MNRTVNEVDQVPPVSEFNIGGGVPASEIGYVCSREGRKKHQAYQHQRCQF